MCPVEVVHVFACYRDCISSTATTNGSKSNTNAVSDGDCNAVGVIAE